MNEKIYLMHPLQDVAAVSKIYTLYYFEYNPDYRSPGERHGFWELNYADKGTIYVSCDQQEHCVSEGNLILIPPDRHHILRANGQTPANAFIVSFDAHSPVLDRLGCIVMTATPAIRELMRSLSHEADQAFRLPMPLTAVNRLEERDDAPAGSQQLVRLRLEELLIRIIREATAAPHNTGTRIFTSKARFDDCIAECIQAILERERCRPLKLTDLTRELGYGKTYLSGVFKKVYGVSIMARHAELRLEEAKYLLREGRLTAAEISDRLGFSTPQYFSRFFSQMENMSPRQYIRSIKEQWSVPMEE